MLEVLKAASREFVEHDIIVLGESFHGEHNFGKNVKFLGAVSESKMLEMFRPGRVGLVISHSNPSLVPFEMLNHGMLVCTNSEWSNNFDLNIDGVEFFPPLPSETLDALKRAVEKSRLSQEHRIGNLNHLDWDHVSQKFSNFIVERLRS